MDFLPDIPHIYHTTFIARMHSVTVSSISLSIHHALLLQLFPFLSHCIIPFFPCSLVWSAAFHSPSVSHIFLLTSSSFSFPLTGLLCTLFPTHLSPCHLSISYSPSSPLPSPPLISSPLLMHYIPVKSLSDLGRCNML